MHAIAFHRGAEGDLWDAVVYYEERASGLGDAFLDEVEQAVQRVREFPTSWTIYEGEYRRCLLRRFPYGLIYRVEPLRVFIIAVAHLRREPGYWHTRV